jgi:outer membrane protein assembly factor BamB
MVRGPHLVAAWKNTTGGTSPVVAGNLLWIYDYQGGALDVYEPTSGTRLGSLPAGTGHWSTPIVIDGRVALPEGDANRRETSGVLNIYRLP